MQFCSYFTYFNSIIEMKIICKKSHTSRINISLHNKILLINLNSRDCEYDFQRNVLNKNEKFEIMY